MKGTLRAAAVLTAGVCLFVVVPLSNAQQRPLPDPVSIEAQDLLTRGVEAYRQGDFDRAIELFSECVKREPDNLKARIYLATAYASLYIPGAPSEENMANGQKSIEQFRQVLRLDPNNLHAIDGIGSVLFQMAGSPYDPKKFEESRTLHKQHITLKPDDPEPYYWGRRHCLGPSLPGQRPTAQRIQRIQHAP